VLDKETGATRHMHFFDLPTLLGPGDCLVLNDSRVLPARLLGHREPTGGAVEVLLLIDRGDKVWECLVRPGRKLKPGTRLSFGDGSLKAEVVEVCEGGNRLVRFEYEGIFLETLERLGKMPLPPYIKAELSDPERYQTVYSREVGSAAAPTAGLHFTRALLEQVQEMGVKVCYVTLHVGLGTFRPVKEEEITDHEMHSEYCMISAETAETINRTKREAGHLCGYHLLPHHRELGGGGRHVEGVRGVDEYLHLSRLSLQGAGLPYHQLPSARVHPYHAGIRPGGPGACPGRL
jgi:S-adenosylmethionine:tRNA ribosyltransferase-isomerase